MLSEFVTDFIKDPELMDLWLRSRQAHNELGKWTMLVSSRVHEVDLMPRSTNAKSTPDDATRPWDTEPPFASSRH